MQFSKITAIGAFSSLIILAGCQEDPDAAANKLFVEASTEVAAYHDGLQSDAAPNEQLAHLQTAIADLNKITSDYPSTNVAVNVVSLDKSDDLYLPTLQDALKQTKRAAFCHDNPDDTTCQFDDLIEKQLSTFNPSNIDKNAQLLIFALSATRRYDDLFEILRKTGTNQNIPIAAGLPVFFFPATYQDMDALKRLEAFNIERGKRALRPEDWETVAKIPQIVQTNTYAAPPPPPPATPLKEHATRMFDFLEAGKNSEVQDEVRKIYIMLRNQPTAAEQEQQARTFLDRTTDQLKTWANAAEAG